MTALHDCTDDARFWANTAPGQDDEQCWEWAAATGTSGYGRFRLHGDVIWAHRYAYEAEVGPIPAGLFVCHRCDNRACVNPAHLFLGTNDENMADMRAKGRSATGDRNGSWTSPARRPRGARNGAARIDERDTVAIRHLRSSGVRQLDVAGRFGISQSTVSRISARKTWTHVD